MSFTTFVKDSFGNRYFVRNDAHETFQLLDEMICEFDDDWEKFEYYRKQFDDIFEKWKI